jgi:hypothetical protein
MIGGTLHTTCDNEVVFFIEDWLFILTSLGWKIGWSLTFRNLRIM